MHKSDDVVSELVDRRSLLKHAGFAAAAGVMLSAGHASAQHEGHEHHHGSGGKYGTLIAAANGCVLTAEACLAHCVSSFKTGDTTLAECAATVLELTASCTALARLASYDSNHTKAMAAVAAEICKECEAQCRKHEHHPQCKACADSCVACMKECKAVLG